MKIITSNLFIDYDGDRTRSLLDSKLLTMTDPDIIMVQELHYKQKEIFDNALSDYICVFPTYTHMACGIYVKKGFVVSNHVYLPYTQTFMDRGMYAVCVDDVWYITSHLESLNKQQFEKIRLSQIAEIEKFIYDKPTVVIGLDSNVIGDVNIYNVFDAWYDNPVPTWFAERYFGYDAKERYDRFLTKGISITNKEIIKNQYSDHDILYIQI